MLPPHEWVERLQHAETDHPAKKLLGLWRTAYCNGKKQGRETTDIKGIKEGKEAASNAGGEVGKVQEKADGAADKEQQQQEEKQVVFELEKTLQVAPVLATVMPLDEEYFGKIWGWILEQDGGVG